MAVILGLPGYVQRGRGRVRVSHTLVFKLANLDTSETADISSVCLTRKMNRRLNLTRGATIEVPANHALITDVFGSDGGQVARESDRKLIVTRDGETIHHARVFLDERVGDGRKERQTLTSFDPLMELGYDADDRGGRVVRDSTGNFVDPTFTGTGSGGPDVISGPDLIQQVLTNSMNGDPLVGEGAFPIDLGGSFDIDVPPAIDLSVIDTMDWPILAGDFLVQLLATDTFDIDLRPLAIGELADGYKMVQLSALNRVGSDKSGTVHFDYRTGSKNAGRVRYISDFATILNKLLDYLGPRLDKRHWVSNIAPDSPGVTPDVAPSRARFGGPDGGQIIQIRVKDSIGSESSSRPLYLAEYNAELGLRLLPRKLLYITPNMNAKAAFEPFTDYDVGDEVEINVARLGLSIAATQKIHGFDVEWDRNGVERVSEFLTTAEEGS